MKKTFISALFFLSIFPLIAQTISGELKKWHKVTLSVDLPSTALTESDATFKNHRMDVIFTAPSGATFRVPGHFDSDGDPGNTGAKEGRNFKAYLRPNETGAWTYEVLYYTGTDVALSDVSSLPAPAQTLTGNVGSITDNDKQLPDLRAQGRLAVQKTGDNKQRRYFKFSETGEYFLKFGPDSPENFLNFNEIDHDVAKNTCALCPTHKFTPHAGNYNEGDPTWNNGKGKNIIGAINYLKAQKMNSMSMSLYGGDDKNVFAWTGPNNKFTYDTSKLAQWEIVLSHAEKSGLVLHLKLSEAENWDLLNSEQIKVFYREMIARFGHHLAIEWNISEEYGNQGATVATAATAIERIDFMADNDPWQNPRVIHTYPDRHFLYAEWLKLGARLDGASIQSSQKNNYASAYDGPDGILTWINNSKNNGTPWVVASDEQNPGKTGIFTSEAIGNSSVKKEARTRILWKTHIAGGQGVMWYGGGQGDFRTENFDRFNTLFQWSRFAVLHFFKNNQIEFWKTENRDDLVSGAGNNCLAEVGKTYVIYLENGGTTNLNLSGQTGNYSVKWFDPRNGGGLKDGSVTSVAAGASISIGNPPEKASEDWVALVRAEGTEPVVTDPETLDTRCTFKLNAISDFPNTDITGFVPATVDNERRALSVNSTVHPGKFAAATTTFTGLDGTYRLRLNTVAEEDGESTYKIKVNDVEVAAFTNPETTEAFLSVQSDIFENIILKTGDVIQVEFNSITNGKIPENGGTAFARGRWTSLEIFCPSASIISGFTGGKGDKCEFDFEEINGSAILEAESIDTGSTRWLRKDEKPGFTGTSYLEWLGNDFFNTPGNGVISAKVKINTPGKYRFIWRTTVGEGNNNTEANDSWVRLPDADDFYGEKPDGSRTYPVGDPQGRTPTPEGASGDGWMKSYVNNLNWSFQSVTGDNADGRAIFAEFNTAGIYTIELSGRSKHHLIDRIALSRGTNVEDTNLVETRCADAPTAPLPGEEPVILDCSGAPSGFKYVSTEDISNTVASVTLELDNEPGNTRKIEVRAFENTFSGNIGDPHIFKLISDGATTVTFNDLKNGQNYVFVARSLCEGEPPSASTEATGKAGTNATPPVPDGPAPDCSVGPTNFKVIAKTKTSVTVQFDNTPDDKRRFELRVFDGIGSFNGSINTDVNGKPAVVFKAGNAGENKITVDSGLIEGNSYDLVIRSLCNPGASPTSVTNVTLDGSVVVEPDPIISIALNNFETQVIGESCPDSDDGRINIKATDNKLNYTAKITKGDFISTKKFTQDVSFDKLDGGKYAIEITVDESPDFVQRLSVEVKTPELKVSAKVSQSKKQLTVSLSGASSYQIELNRKTFFTSDNEFTVDLVNGENNLIVKTEKDCLGTHSSKIIIDANKFGIYPNPVEDNLNITLANPEESVLITIHDISGKTVSQFSKSGVSGEISTNVSSLGSGVYFISVQGKATIENVKIIKK